MRLSRIELYINIKLKLDLKKRVVHAQTVLNLVKKQVINYKVLHCIAEHEYIIFHMSSQYLITYGIKDNIPVFDFV